MVKRIPDEVRQKVREEVKKGRSRNQVALELGISPRTACYITADFPKRKRRTLSKEIKQKIINAVENGKSRPVVARKIGVSYATVYRLTDYIKILRGEYNKGIRGKPLKLLQILMKQSYFIPKPAVENQDTNQSYRRLIKSFPIKRVRVGLNYIYFLEYKKMEAFRDFVSRQRNKTFEYTKLRSMMTLFGIPLKELGKIRRDNEKFERTNFKKQNLHKAVSNFVGSFLHSELLNP